MTALVVVGIATTIVAIDLGSAWPAPASAVLFLVAFTASLRLFFDDELSELVACLPQPQRFHRWLRLQPALSQ